MARENIRLLPALLLIVGYLLNIFCLNEMINNGLKTGNHYLWIFSLLLMGLSGYLKHQKRMYSRKYKRKILILIFIDYINAGLFFTFIIGTALIGFDSFNIASFFFNCFFLCITSTIFLFIWKKINRL